MISNKELNELIKGMSKADLHSLIIAGVNEVIPMTDNQLLRLVRIKEMNR